MKAQKIYNIAMALMDEYLDNGNVDMDSTKDYQARTPGILTQLSTIVAMEMRKYKADMQMPAEVTKITSDVELDDEICLTILPSGLAGRLLATEDVNLSNYYTTMFEEGMANYLRQYREPVKQIEREDVYNSTLRAGD